MPKRHPEPRQANKTSAEKKLFGENLTFSVMVLANLIGRNTSNQTLANFKINVNEWRVLRVASMLDQVCAADVTGTLGMDKTTVSRAITNLHRAGYIELQPNADDRRQTLIVLTDKGWTLHGRIAPVDETVDRSFEKQLTATEIDYFRRIMVKLRTFAQQLGDNKRDTGKP